MSLELLSLGVNVLIIILLAVMIFYARRLSNSIEIFRNSRKEMDGLIRDLSMHIDKANTAIKNMRRESAESADELHDMINKAHTLKHELEYIYQAGDRLASRLEGGVAGKIPDKRTKKSSTGKTPVFDIVDRDNVSDEKEEAPLPSFLSDTNDDQNVPEDLQSQAERDLAAALQGRRGNQKKG